MPNQLVIPLISVKVGAAAIAALLLIRIVYKRYLKGNFSEIGPRFMIIWPHDQRRMIRVGAHWGLELTDSSEPKTTQTAQLVNITLGGICFSSPFSFKRGDVIEAILHTSEEGDVKITGRIVWLKLEATNTLYGVEII